MTMTGCSPTGPSGVPRERFDWLRSVAFSRDCVTVAIDNGKRLRLLDSVVALPGDKFLVVEEESLWGESARCRVVTVVFKLGVRTARTGEVTPWHVEVGPSREHERQAWNAPRVGSCPPDLSEIAAIISSEVAKHRVFLGGAVRGREAGLTMYWSNESVAQLLDVPVRFVERLVEHGELKAVKLGHRTLRVTDESLRAYQRKKERGR